MRPRRDPESERLPAPPRIRRAIELGAGHTIGLLLLALIVALSAAGVLVDSGDAREAIWRVVFVYAFLMAAFRLTGKREVGQMSPFELVTLLLIPELFSSALNRNSQSVGLATTAVATLFLLVVLTGLLTFSSRKAEEILEGRAAILVRDGVLIEKTLRRERVTPEEIFTEMRLAGVDHLEDVRWAILETEGKIAIIPRVTSQ